jgi:hypothetical protein
MSSQELYEPVSVESIIERLLEGTGKNHIVIHTRTHVTATAFCFQFAVLVLENKPRCPSTRSTGYAHAPVRFFLRSP